MNMRALSLIPLLLAVSACGVLPFGKGKTEAPPSGIATEFAPKVATTPLGGTGQAVSVFDTTSAEEKAAALAAPAAGGEQRLGTAVVALGAPAEAGLWLRTDLVSSARKGRVTAPNGQSLAVELRPGTGGALLSLAAYQALGLSLTDLPQLTIFGG